MAIFDTIKNFFKVARKENLPPGKTGAPSGILENIQQTSDLQRDRLTERQPPQPSFGQKGLGYERPESGLGEVSSNEKASSQTAVLEEAKPSMRKPDEPTTSLTYEPYEIIPRNSSFLYYQKSLLNADRFQKEGEFNTSISIYKRMLNKISDRSIREKLEANLTDLGQMLTQQRQGGTTSQPPEGTSAETDRVQPEAEHFSGGSMPNKIVQHIVQGAMDAQKALLEAIKTNIPKTHPEPPEVEGDNLEEIQEEAQDQVSQGEDEQDQSKEVEEERENEQSHDPEPKKDITDRASTEEEESPKEDAAPFQDKTRSHSLEDSDLITKKRRRKREAPILDVLEEIISSSEEPPLRSKNGSGRSEPSIERIPVERKDTLRRAESEAPPEPQQPKESSEPQEIRGVMEIKPPEPKDSPFLVLSYDFTRIPYSFELSKNNSLLEYVYYKYKPMLIKAQKLVRNKQIAKALNYYRTISEQEIPDEFRAMIDRNIKDITQFMGRYFSSLHSSS